ncbi:MAG TPA: Ig-like domain-containing protein [Actinomycetota bacterium]|nr:Ig-like domain-containing protein [Actinomycetota bacterium]
MTRPRAPWLAVLVVLSALATLLPAASVQAQVPEVPSNLNCDPLDPKMCLLPFPNDLFTVPDASMDTGRRVNFGLDAMPRSGADVSTGGEGKPIDPAEWNRNDGFSPGSMVMTYVPGIDLHATWGTQSRAHSTAGPNEVGYFDHRDTIADPGLSLAPDAPMVIINADTGERHPFWSELDTHPGAVEAGEQVLILRPAVNFEEGARYIVALRNLTNLSGETIATGQEFEAYTGGSGSNADRQAHYDTDIFPALASAGVTKDDLYLAWDFTIASEDNLAERMLSMRDDAFGRILGDTNLADRQLGDSSAPSFVVDEVTERDDNYADAHGVAHKQRIRQIDGRITVPNYMDRIQQTEGHVKANQLPADGPAPLSRLYDDPLDPDTLPDQNPVEPLVNVPFSCEVAIAQDGQPLERENHPMLYGHGLLGTRSQVGDLKTPRRAAPFMGCGVDWWGMSTPDLPSVAAAIADLSNFGTIPDRAQQGFLNFMFTGRALIHPDGFASDPAFQLNGQSLINVDDGEGSTLFYDGNSQGGIMGGSLVAVSPDIVRGILGVPGMNYSTLLNRSVDYEDLYAIPQYQVYRDPVERQLVFGLIQMLWDRGEANGFAHHMTDDPYANTPSHEVMLQVAWGDHQVANVAAEVEARTIGAPIMTPGLPAGRHWEMDPYFTPTATYPYQGSALVYWDSGNIMPPNGNIPADDNPAAPRENGDPHSHGRDEYAAGWQEAHFLLTGWLEDVCGGGDYLTRRHQDNNDTASCVPPEWAPGNKPNAPAPTGITLTVTEGKRHKTSLEAVLRDAESGAGLADRVIEFFADGESIGAATTGADGRATLSLPKKYRGGHHSFEARFPGDDDYGPSTGSAAT